MANGRSFAPDTRIGTAWTAARSIGVSARVYQELKTTLASRVAQSHRLGEAHLA